MRCPLEAILRRRSAIGDITESEHGAVPRPIRLWQEHMHVPGIYDLEVDASILSAKACAAAIRRRLIEGPPPSAFRQLGLSGGSSA